MEKWMVKSIELLLKLSFLKKKNPAVIPYAPQKCEVSGFEPSCFHRARPEKLGISRSYVSRIEKRALEKLKAHFEK